RHLFAPLVRDAPAVLAAALAPLRIPRHPVGPARFGIAALRPATAVAKRFRGRDARALFAGSAAHSMLPLTAAPSAAFGVLLTMLGHAVGWPLARGGSQRIADAMAAYLGTLGGEIRTSSEVGSIDELPPARSVLLDVGPRALARIAAGRLPASYRRR